MVIRERGKMKWQPATFIPLAFEMTSEVFKDQSRTAMANFRRISDERVRPAYRVRNRIRSWSKVNCQDDGFTHDITGRVHYVDPTTQEVRIEQKPSEFVRVSFDSVIGVKVLN